MPDIQQMTSELRGLPDQALQNELTHPTGVVPSYLVLAEAQRRQLMRTAAQKQQTQGQSGSVMDDVVRNMMASQPPQGGPPAPAGMTPPRQGPPPVPGAAPPSQMQMAHGGALRFAEGDLMEDDAGGDDIYDDSDAAQPEVPEVQAQGSASRAAPDVDSLVDQYSKQYGIDSKLARAVMQGESGGREDARSTHRPRASGSGAVGLFQLEPGTAKEMGVDPTDPEQNIKGGIGYLRKMLDHYNGDLRKALAAYNAGPGAVDKYGDVPPYKETQNYVASIEKKLNPTPSLVSSLAHPVLPSRLLQDTRPTVQLGPIQPEQPVEQTTPAQGSADTATTTTGSTETASEQPSPADVPIPETATVPATAGGANRAASTPPAPAAPATIPTAQAYDPYSTANIEKNRQMYDLLTGGSPEMRQQLAAQRTATIQQLQALRDDAITRYRNPSPWEFLANIGAGMGASHQLSGALSFAQGVGHAWDVRDQQQNQALSEAEKLQQRIDAIQNVGQTEQERMGRDLVTLIGQQTKDKGRQPTALQAANTLGIIETLNNHPDQWPVDANGQRVDPSILRLTDLPAALQHEADWRGRIHHDGWTANNVKALAADESAPQDLRAAAIQNQAGQVAQTEATSKARAKGTGEAQAELLSPEALDELSELAVNGKPIPGMRSPYAMGQIWDAAAKKLRDRGFTAQAGLMARNAAQANQAALTSITKMASQVENFSTVAQKNMEVAEKQAKLVTDLGAPVLNAPIRDLESRFQGNPKVTAFRAALYPVQSEIARVLNTAGATGGVLSDHARAEMQRAVGEDATYEQIHAALDVFRTDMQNRKDTFTAQMEDLKQKSVVGGGATQQPGAKRTATDPKTLRKIVTTDGGKTWTWQDTGEKVQ